MESQDVSFIRGIVEQIVESPDEVSIERRIDDRGVLLTLKCAKEDAARVIGKGGQTIIALRTLLRIVGIRMNAKIALRMHDSLTLNHNKSYFDENMA